MKKKGDTHKKSNQRFNFTLCVSNILNVDSLPERITSAEQQKDTTNEQKNNKEFIPKSNKGNRITMHYKRTSTHRKWNEKKCGVERDTNRQQRYKTYEKVNMMRISSAYLIFSIKWIPCTHTQHIHTIHIVREREWKKFLGMWDSKQYHIIYPMQSMLFFWAFFLQFSRVLRIIFFLPFIIFGVCWEHHIWGSRSIAISTKKAFPSPKIPEGEHFHFFCWSK